jgi:hypothetical protein
MSSYANPSGYKFASVPGSLVNQGIGGLVDLGNKYKDNATIGGLVAGSLADVSRTQANTGLALQYNDAFLGSLANYQSGLESLKTGNTMKLMGAEGAVARDLIGKQGDEQRSTIRTTGEQDRLGMQTAGSEERLTLGERTNQELRMRTDARGAVRTQGARFFG